jgi:glycosyltransferase involved in cell wall biosynthesis
MISVCIPVYNTNITELILELTRQGNDFSFDYEIILIDDCSEIEYRIANEAVSGTCKYIQLDRNVGRARIRNLFQDHARYEYLLFLDCDSVIIRKDFLLRYVNEILEHGSKVICGGRVYETVSPSPDRRLRWKYGTERESQLPSVREASPFRFFMSNNFLIDRKVFEQIRFDDRLIEYGYEDTLFGYLLMKNQVMIRHIDNPVLHGCLENNSEFLEKTEKSIANLLRILHFTGSDDAFVNNIRLLNFHRTICRMRLEKISRLSLNQLIPLFKSMLSRGFIFMWIYDLYKLGLLMQAGELPLAPSIDHSADLRQIFGKSNTDC